MKPIPVADEAVVRIDDVSRHVFGLRIGFVNLFAFRDGTGWSLADAGLYGSATRILEWTRQHFGAARPRAIFLTHAHFDHVGALDELMRAWDVPVYGHPR